MKLPESVQNNTGIFPENSLVSIHKVTKYSLSYRKGKQKVKLGLGLVYYTRDKASEGGGRGNELWARRSSYMMEEKGLSWERDCFADNYHGT